MKASHGPAVEREFYGSTAINATAVDTREGPRVIWAHPHTSPRPSAQDATRRVIGCGIALEHQP